MKTCGRTAKLPLQVYSYGGPALVVDVTCELEAGHEVGAPGDPGWSGTHVGYDWKLNLRIHFTEADMEGAP